MSKGFIMNFKQLLNETLTKRMKGILDGESNIHDKNEKLMKQGLKSPDEGSARHYYQLRTSKKIVIDGIKTAIPHGVKIAARTDLDDYHTDEPFGIRQNKTESDPLLKRFSVLIPHETKTEEYVTNDSGILAPVFDHENDGKWLEMAHVEPLRYKNMSEIEHSKITDRVASILKHDNFPNVKTINDLRETILHLSHKMQNSAYKMPQEHMQRVIHHPVIRKFCEIVANTNLYAGDMSENNMGIWKHPITNKDHLVLHDYGASNKIMDDYKKVFHKIQNGGNKLLETLMEHMK